MRTLLQAQQRIGTQGKSIRNMLSNSANQLTHVCTYQGQIFNQDEGFIQYIRHVNNILFATKKVPLLKTGIRTRTLR